MKMVKNKKYLLVIADSNDGDYLHSLTEITDEQIEELKPIIAVVKNVYDTAVKEKKWNDRHNWENGEYGHGITPQNLYVETGLLTEEQVDIFEEYVPYGEYGVHTIEHINVVELNEELY